MAERDQRIGTGCAASWDVAREQQIGAFQISELDHNELLGRLRFCAFQINFFTALDGTALEQERQGYVV